MVCENQAGNASAVVLKSEQREKEKKQKVAKEKKNERREIPQSQRYQYEPIVTVQVSRNLGSIFIKCDFLVSKVNF